MGPLQWFQQCEARCLTASPTEALYLTALLCYFKTNEPRPQELTACSPPAIEICGLSVLSSLQISVAAYSLLVRNFLPNLSLGKEARVQEYRILIAPHSQKPHDPQL